MTTNIYVLHPQLRQEDSTRMGVDRDAESRLGEAVSLTSALEDLHIFGAEIVWMSRHTPATYIGPGKVEELAVQFADDSVDVVMVNTALSPTQQRNLERAWKRKVLDRTGLILEIFGARAKTREGVLQVDLAHLTYQKSRLVRSWTHLERQRGGAGFMGGPGETQIETDRRLIDEKITRLKRQLEKVVRTRSLHRESRRKAPYPVIALVGYTNAGKSTLFNYLTTSEVLAKDMLFATLDPTIRGLDLPSGRRVVLSDTVGFVSDLPTQLVAAFRATLEEVLEADVIIHVRDVSNPEYESQSEDVWKVMRALGVEESRLEQAIEVYNKLDLLDSEARGQWLTQAGRMPRAVCVSAISGENTKELLDLVEETLTANAQPYHLTLAAEQGEALAWLYRIGSVLSCEHNDDGELQLELRLNEQEKGQFIKAYAGFYTGGYPQLRLA